MSKPQITVFNDDGDELSIPSRFEVCPRCRGTGSHVNPAIDGNGLSAEDIDDAGPEFLDDYLGGVYDVQCYQCEGTRVVAVPDLERCSDAEREAWERHERSLDELRREERAERMAEGGYRELW